jgi:putative ABC transport system permease protein
MLWARLVGRYATQHRLRFALVLFGMATAIAAFGCLRAVITAWDGRTGAESAMRLVTHHAASLSNTLPIAYWNRIRRLDGVEAVTHVHWFNGTFKEGADFFPKFAVDPASYLAVYNEIRVADADRDAFFADRSGCIIGARLAARYGLRAGDRMILRGNRFGGLWSFTVRGVFSSPVAQQEWQMLFHWTLLSETLRARSEYRGQQVGAYVTRLASAHDVAALSARIDALFAHAPDATRTEAENSFLVGRLYSTEALFALVSAISALIVATLVLVLSNTLLLSARERYRDFGTLKAMGCGPLFIAALLLGESLLVAVAGGVVGVALTPPLLHAFGALVGGLLPTVAIGAPVVLGQLAAALGIGVAGAIMPAVMILRRPVVDTLRGIG